MILMALSKKSVYTILIFAIGVLFFLYSVSNSIEGNFYRLSPRIMYENTSHSSSLLYNLDKKNLTNTPIVSDEKTNTSESTSILKIEVLQNVSVTTIKIESGKKNSSVIQHIAQRPNNKSTDSIAQGIVTKSLYDSGFILPSDEICPDFGQELQVAIIVTSAPKHDAARMAIRRTWGHFQQMFDVAIAFLIGRTPDADLPSIKKEASLYGDVIQANFIDSYNNLTLKTISMLEWIDNYCHRVKFVLKTDDDVFINIPRLMTFLFKHVQDKRRIFGRLAKNWKPLRDKSSKYYVSLQQYKNPIFPDFTTGPAYAITSDVIHDLYVTALSKTYLKLEDVYTTGIVAQDKKIQRIHINEFFNERVTLNACNIQKGISIHMVEPFEQYKSWKKLLEDRSKCFK